MAVKAAQYVRMSTDQQAGSIEIQRAAIAQYACAHDIEIVASYVDEGKSGLTLYKRDGMMGLLRDVIAPTCPFSQLLVLDVSRWGRFQDVDESAYYEYHCRRHGVDVVYVAEPFHRTATPLENLVKQLKRVMAAEYSRELALKIKAGQERAMQLGCVASGPPSIGYQRLAVSARGEPKRLLRRGERKPLMTDRVRWVPGPSDQVELVRKIFDLYTTSNVSTWEIADQLNVAGHTNSTGHAFTRGGIRKILSCELYVGTYVFRKTGRRNGRPRIPHAERQRIRCEGFVEPIVDASVWKRAAQKLARPEPGRPRPLPYTRESLIRSLRALLDKDPLLPGWALKAAGQPSMDIYQRNFGSFAAASAAAGRAWTKKAWRDRQLSGLRLVHTLFDDVIGLLARHGVPFKSNKRKCTLTLSSTTVRLKVAHVMSAGDQCGWLWMKGNWKDGWLLLMRQNADGTGRDFHLIPPGLHAFVPHYIPPQGMRQFAEFQITDASTLVDRLASFGAKQPN